MSSKVPQEMSDGLKSASLHPSEPVGSILDDVGISLQTKFRYTHWVSLRDLILAVLEDRECRVAAKRFLDITPIRFEVDKE